MIAIAKQSGSSVLVYDEKGALLISLSGKLYGYTAHTVSTKSGNQINVYDKKGNLLFSIWGKKWKKMKYRIF